MKNEAKHLLQEIFHHFTRKRCFPNMKHKCVPWAISAFQDILMTAVGYEAKQLLILAIESIVKRVNVHTSMKEDANDPFSTQFDALGQS